MKIPFFKIVHCLSIAFFVVVIFISCQKTSMAPNVTQIAEEIIPDAGVIFSFWQGKSNKAALIFEETHISRVGQIEIALMLARLHNRYNVNIIALEGAFIKDGALDQNWFIDLPDEYIREEVALELLRRGEINAAEFITLAIPEVEVYGVEKEEEYVFEISYLDESSAMGYLFAIAEKLFPDDNDKIAQVNRLVDEMEEASEEDKPAKFKELMDYVINVNQWTKERYKNLLTKDKVISTEELLNNLNEIRTKAEEVNANVREYEGNFGRLVEFYKRASKRTETMISSVLKLSDKKRKSLIPVIMGAAHTAKASEILKKQGISHAVISPIALDKGADTGDLTLDAFERKRRKLSTDDTGLIGSFLDGRWKPSPVMGQIWLRSDSELRYITVLLAHAVAKGDRPPFESLRNEFSKLKYVKIDPKSFKVVGDEVIFKAEAQTNKPNYWETLWGRAVVIAYKERKSLEKRLKEILEDAREKGIPIEEKEGVKIERVSLDTIAAYSREFGVINGIKLRG